jgi:hypothetical protein
MVPAGLELSFSGLRLRGSILLLVYRMVGRLDVTGGVWKSV